MSSTIFTGVATALITPMHEDGSVNLSKIDEIIEEQIEGGVAAIVSCGTTGEGSTLSREEHIDVMRHTIKAVNHRVPVIAGTGSNDTAFAVELSKEAEEMGADGLLLVSPYYNKASQKGLVEHYTYIADRVNIPIILYNVPSRTGTSISCDTYKVLSKHKNIVALKEANGDISSVAHTVALCGEDLDVYSGNDDQVIPMVSLGGKGVISVFSNFAPKIMSEITGLALDGKFKEATSLQCKYLDLMNSMFIDVNPIPVKEAMNLLGYDVGPCRLPLCSTTPEKLEKIKSALKGVGLL